VPHHRSLGSVPPKRHTQHRTPGGGLHYEELMGEEGFSSDSSLLYHRGIPSAIVDATPWEPPDQALTENRPLVPRHLRLHELGTADWKAVDTFHPLALGEGATASEDPGYAWTWAGRGPGR
jgi:homogentisate 1,2-dioxygenase